MMMLLATTLLQAAIVATSDRVVVSLNFGWRTTNGDGSSGDSCLFPVPLNTVQCNGLQHIQEATNAKACEAAACTSEEHAWQFAATQGCWIGACSSIYQNSSDWVGGAKTGGNTPAANATQAKPGYDDASWKVVDIPHDATVTGKYQSTANGGEGFLPPVRSW